MTEAAELGAIADNTESSGSASNKPSQRYGIYRAICVDPADPKKSGRIKVNIPALDITETDVEKDGVWAYPCTPFASPNLEKKGEKVSDFGSLYVPPKFSIVFVFFEDGDPSRPRYFGGATLENAIPTENRVGSEWWNKHTVIKSMDKRMVFVSDDNSNDASVIIRGKDRNVS